MSTSIGVAWERLILFCREHPYMRVELPLRNGQPMCEGNGDGMGTSPSRAWAQVIETCLQWQDATVILNIAEGEPVMLRRELEGPVVGVFEMTVKLPSY